MTNLNIPIGSTATLDLSDEAVDSGWTILDTMAIHYPCNAGIIKKLSALVVGHTYIVTYDVVNYVSGIVRPLIGTSAGADRSANGTFTDTIVANGSGQLQFYSDGFLAIKNVAYYDNSDSSQPAITISFQEDEKHWGTDYSFFPDLMMKFSNQLITFKNGAAWLHNVNEVRNNFYGVQYNSIIDFYDNINPTTVKVYFSMRVQGNSRWFSPNLGDISVFPVEGRVSGMQSRLKKNNFKNYQGAYFADFLRNGTDARFETQLEALFKGEPLRGRILEVVIMNEETTEAILFEIDIKSASSNITY